MTNGRSGRAFVRFLNIVTHRPQMLGVGCHEVYQRSDMIGPRQVPHPAMTSPK